MGAVRVGHPSPDAGNKPSGGGSIWEEHWCTGQLSGSPNACRVLWHTAQHNGSERTPVESAMGSRTSASCSSRRGQLCMRIARQAHTVPTVFGPTACRLQTSQAAQQLTKPATAAAKSPDSCVLYSAAPPPLT